MDPTESVPTTDPAPLPGDPVETSPVPSETSPPVDEAQQLRNEVATLRSQIDALSARATPPAESKPAPPPLTPELIEQEFAAGRITDGDRVRLHARLEAQRMRAEDDERRSIDDASRDLGTLITHHPELGRTGSALLNAVSAELRAWQRTNPRLDPTDVRVQVLATNAVLGRRGVVPAVPSSPDSREFGRRRIPVGGGGGGAPAEPAPTGPQKSKGEQIWDRLIPEARLSFQSYANPGNPSAADMKKVFKTLDFADESRLAKAGWLK